MGQKRIMAQKHRHAEPSGPWPWIDNDEHVADTFNEVAAEPHRCPHPPGECVGCWELYPRSLFPNWTPAQVYRSQIKSIQPLLGDRTIRRVDVMYDGTFKDPGTRTVGTDEDLWRKMQQSARSEDVCVRTLFVDSLSVPILQMLGTRYEVEPFFWSSSINWIPARYQENLRVDQGDHITITLTFPRSVRQDTTYSPSISRVMIHEVIDTQSPLPLRTGDRDRSHTLVLDLLAIHMVRDVKSSTIISYQPTSDRQVTSASSLHSRVLLAGQSVYWKNTIRSSNDPTFVLLTMLWYALYAWDQALELLWEHICQLELNVISTNNISFTQELYRIRAHLLHYTSLLDDFRKSVEFVRDTPNPAMNSPRHVHEREFSRKLLMKECKNLLTQIERLSTSRVMWDKRLANVMNLAFSSVNIEDSKHMQRLTEATVRDSAAMKQIAYLTMVFLPASFVASVFGMNIREINPDSRGTLAHYVEAAIPMTLVTMWLVVALHGKWSQNDEQNRRWMRFAWPVLQARSWMERKRLQRQQQLRHVKTVNEEV